MKKDIHPKYVECKVTCGCGNTFSTRCTVPTLAVEVCSNCHPFFTGTQKFIDTAGRVERFQKKYGWDAKQVVTRADAAEKEAAAKPKRKVASLKKVEFLKPKVAQVMTPEAAGAEAGGRGAGGPGGAGGAGGGGGRPGGAGGGGGRPGGAGGGGGRPGGGRGGRGKRAAPVSTERLRTPKPKAEEPAAEAPKAEEPKAEAPKAEAPKTEAPKAEAPKTAEPQAEAPKTEEKKS